MVSRVAQVLSKIRIESATATMPYQLEFLQRIAFIGGSSVAIKEFANAAADRSNIASETADVAPASARLCPARYVNSTLFAALYDGSVLMSDSMYEVNSAWIPL